MIEHNPGGSFPVRDKIEMRAEGYRIRQSLEFLIERFEWCFELPVVLMVRPSLLLNVPELKVPGLVARARLVEDPPMVALYFYSNETKKLADGVLTSVVGHELVHAEQMSRAGIGSVPKWGTERAYAWELEACVWELAQKAETGLVTDEKALGEVRRSCRCYRALARGREESGSEPGACRAVGGQR